MRTDFGLPFTDKRYRFQRPPDYIGGARGGRAWIANTNGAELSHGGSESYSVGTVGFLASEEAFNELV